MTARRVLFGQLAVVAAAAAVLSFAALDELGTLCGFGLLAPLLPVVVDAGAAAGSVAWLARSSAPAPARVFGRALALVLLASSVAGNALSHALTAYAVAPAWGVVVAVSAVPPAVLGAVVHLAVLATTTGPARAVEPPAEPAGHPVYPDRADGGQPDVSRGHVRRGDDVDPGDRAGELIAAGAGRRRLSRELDISEHQARELLATHRNGVVR